MKRVELPVRCSLRTAPCCTRQTGKPCQGRGTGNPHVLYVTDMNLSESRAPIVHVAEIVNNLRKLGCRITLYCPDMGGFGRRIAARVHAIKVPRENSYLFYYPLLGISLFWELLHEKKDIIYTRQNALLFVPALLARLFSIPYVTEVNGMVEEEQALSGASGARRKFILWSENFCYRSAARIICVTAGLKDYLVRKYHVHPAKIIVIENGVDTAMFRCTKKQRAAREEKGPVIIGYVGSLQQWQGLRHIVRSIHLLKNRGLSAHLVIVGDGPEREPLQELVQRLGLISSVTFIGSVPHKDVPKWIAKFDICVSYHGRDRSGITSPFKVYEYLACCKPVIAGDIHSVSESFCNHVVKVKPEDAASLAAAIERLIRNPKERARLGSMGREFIMQGHTWLHAAQDTLAVLTEEIRKTHVE